jgi:hypothetical protein
MNTVLWVNFDQEVYVIGHNFQPQQLGTRFSTDALDNLFKARINLVDQHWTAVFRTPYYVVFARVNDIIV